MIIVANKMDIKEAQDNFLRLQKMFPEYKIIPCSADSELALKEAAKNNLIKYVPGSDNFEEIGKLKENQKTALDFIKNNVLLKYNSTGVQNVINYIVFDLFA